MNNPATSRPVGQACSKQPADPQTRAHSPAMRPGPPVVRGAAGRSLGQGSPPAGIKRTFHHQPQSQATATPCLQAGQVAEAELADPAPSPPQPGPQGPATEPAGGAPGQALIRPVQAATASRDKRSPDLEPGGGSGAEQASAADPATTGLLFCMPIAPGPDGQKGQGPLQQAAESPEKCRQAVTDSPRTARAAGPKAERNCCAGQGASSRRSAHGVQPCQKAKVHSNVAPRQYQSRGQPPATSPVAAQPRD